MIIGLQVEPKLVLHGGAPKGRRSMKAAEIGMEAIAGYMATSAEATQRQGSGTGATAGQEGHISRGDAVAAEGAEQLQGQRATLERAMEIKQGPGQCQHATSGGGSCLLSCKAQAGWWQ